MEWVQVGPRGQQWREQICPALSSAQIERLVINFTPCASAPQAVPPEVLRDLGRQVRCWAILVALPLSPHTSSP
jgi:hypothetical protein